MINRVVLTGRLTRDIELRRTQSGAAVASFTLAVDRSFKREGQPEADFINCVAWNRSAETMAQYLHKGSLIGVDGRIQTRNYDNQQGQHVYVTEVNVQNFHFLESKGTHQEYQNTQQPQRQEYQGTQKTTTKYDGVRTLGREEYNEPIDIKDSDLPF